MSKVFFHYATIDGGWPSDHRDLVLRVAHAVFAGVLSADAKVEGCAERKSESRQVAARRRRINWRSALYSPGSA